MTHATTALFSRSELLDDSAVGGILVALKPNAEANTAFVVARWLAEHERRQLHVVSVMETASVISPFAAGTPALPPFHDETERREVKRRLRELCEKAGDKLPGYRLDVVEGSAAATITTIAREHDVRLTVIGTGTHGILSHLIYGEQAVEIVRNSRTPVLVVPPATSVPIERAMVAVDFSKASARAALRAHEMLGAGGSLTLVHVKGFLRTKQKSASWWNDAFETRTRETLMQFARILPKRSGVAIDMQILHGAPVEVLTTYAHTHAMQLLACGWHDHALLERMFLHNDSVDLIHQADCAVLVAPEPRTGRDRDDAA